jgi:hypothetical protein
MLILDYSAGPVTVAVFPVRTYYTWPVITVAFPARAYYTWPVITVAFPARAYYAGLSLQLRYRPGFALRPICDTMLIFRRETYETR